MTERTLTWPARLVAMGAALVMLAPVAGAVADEGYVQASGDNSEQAEGEASDMHASTGALFNDPNGPEAEQYKIRDYIQGLVERAPEGSTISMSIYNITDFDLDLATELLRASFNDVSVRLVLEGSVAGESPVGKMLLGALGDDVEADSWAIACDNGCHGNNINHNKFFLFSEVDGERDVVVQSSANFTVLNGRKYWNNAVTFVGKRDLYDGYMEYFADLARNQTDPDYYRTFQDGNVTASVFPVGPSYPIDGLRDPLVDELDAITCTGNESIGDPQGHTIVRATQNYFGRPEVAKKLTKLADDGCVVKVAYTETNFGVGDILLDHPGVELRLLEDLPDQNMIHSKYLVVEGGFDGEMDQHVTITGSPNISYNALNYNDEVMLRIVDPEIYSQYLSNFRDVWFDEGAVTP